MRNRLIRIGYILAFLAVCAGILLFLMEFTRSESPFVYPAWTAGATVSPTGEETPFDPAGPLPELEEGEFYRFTAQLPEDRPDGTFLIFETGGLEAAVFLDGTELWYSAAAQSPETVNLSQVQLPLPAGGGETLTVDLRLLQGSSIVPPLLRISDDPTDQTGAIAYANYYGLPAGASALALALLWGLFLLGLFRGRRNWLLLLPILAASLLTVRRLALGYGNYFLPQAVYSLCSNPWLEWLTALALVLYLLLHRDRVFWRTLGLTAAWSAGALALAGLVSHLRGGYLARYLAGLASELGAGIWDGALYWLIWWLVLVCAALSAWELARFLARAQGEARALALKNRLVMDNYHSIDQRLRETAQLRHEFSHQLIALDTMIQSRNWAGLEQWMAVWRKSSENNPIRYTEHITVNAILQDAAGRARQAGIDFRASAVLLPKTLSIPDEDLCALLMNMLDNALEGAERTPAGRERFVSFQIRARDNFLPIRCENSFDGHVETDERGALRTTKADPSSHGFGLAQMRAVAEKYESSLDVSWTDERFTVQTALQRP